MALMQRYVSFSLVFLATASIFFSAATEAHEAAPAANNDMCAKSDYPPLCRSLVKSQTSPSCATESVVNQLIMETERAKKNLFRFGSTDSQVIKVCQENYDDALSNLHTCLGNLKANDKAAFSSNLSAAISDFETCNDAWSELGETSPVKSTNDLLEHIADTGLYLEGLVHIHLG